MKTIEISTKKLARIDEQINTLLREKEELARHREIRPRLRHENLLHSTFDVYELPAEYAKLSGWNFGVINHVVNHSLIRRSYICNRNGLKTVATPQKRKLNLEELKLNLIQLNLCLYQNLTIYS